MLSSTHFPQPSKPMAFSSSLVDDYVASLTADNAASSSSSSPPSSQQGGASSQPQASAPLHAPLPGPAPVDVLPLRPSPIGTRLPTTEDSSKVGNTTTTTSSSSRGAEEGGVRCQPLTHACGGGFVVGAAASEEPDGADPGGLPSHAVARLPQHPQPRQRGTGHQPR